MILPPWLAAAKGFVGGWWRVAIAGVALSLGTYQLGRCTGAADERTRAEAAVARANVEALRQDAKAAAAAADERLADALAAEQTKKELSDAVSTLPDAAPSDRRVALACARLRRQGTDPADLPARCRSEGGAQAAARPGGSR